MTSATKWFVSVAFSTLVSLVIPAFITGNLLWFSHRWTDALYVSYSFGMWLIATAFVDLNRPRGAPDLANLLIPLGLVLSVPISVWDRNYWIASYIPSFIEIFGILISLTAIVLGIEARRKLGRAYSPRASHSSGSGLVERGLYRWIRHPLYLAAILWAVGWPLIIASLLGSFSAIVFVFPAINRRMNSEENELQRIYGDDYSKYRDRTWRLFPYVY